MSEFTSKIRTIEWIDTYSRMVDQTKFPEKFEYINITTGQDMFDAIKTMIVRGAPAIGIAGAHGVVLLAQELEKENLSREGFVKKLLEEDKAYLCFCTEEENARLHEMQAKANVRGGYYGPFAKCSKLTEDEVLENLKAGKKFVVRFKSLGHYTKKIILEDMVRGKREFPENDLDVVIMKGDGLPTYHFAHAVDDHLMRTTMVVRGDEWLSTWPLHSQLFDALGWKAPKYVHTPTIQKRCQDGNPGIAL